MQPELDELPEAERMDAAFGEVHFHLIFVRGLHALEVKRFEFHSGRLIILTHFGDKG